MSDASAVRADVERAEGLIPWVELPRDGFAALQLLPNLTTHLKRLLGENDIHLRANAELAKRVAAAEARVAELESRVVPGRFYKCGCPVLTCGEWKAFCDTHCKVIREEEVPS